MICAVLIIGYLSLLFLYDPYIISWLNLGATADVRYWLIAVPVLVAFVAILVIGAWIGFTMATTPPPKSIEEINTENKTEEPENTRSNYLPVEAPPKTSSNTPFNDNRGYIVANLRASSRAYVKSCILFFLFYFFPSTLFSSFPC